MSGNIKGLRGWLGAGPALALAMVGANACSQRTVTVQLHPLQSSGDVTFVCKVDSGDVTGLSLGAGRPLDECNPGSISRGERDLYALVTQTTTGEVAVINVPLDPSDMNSDEGILDIDPAVPGYGFLHIGAKPVHIVTTPGAFASFVGVAEVGKPGIYGLPTKCVSPPAEGESDRELTTWPACSLPAAPGAMVVAVDPPVNGQVARSCQRLADDFESPEKDDGSEGVPASDCSTDLRQEDGPDGRRKLLVALPDRGTIAVIDAQRVLNRAPGTFQPCEVEAEIPLRADFPVTPPSQVVPEDLADSLCQPAQQPTPPVPSAFHSTPSDFELAGGKLYVADSTAPVVHVLNAEQPCALDEGTPLLPLSFDNRGRVVTTSKIAVSPLTPSGKRFAYAIDQYDAPKATVMAFDVSPGSTDRTPIVRPRAPYFPDEAPDRLAFSGGSAQDLTFVLRDRPRVDPNTGNVVVGAACEPDPRLSNSAGAAYRPTADSTTGARASELRGLFASVLLTSGQVSMVDVEDFDAACRRPVTPNPTDVEDFRGCKGDPEGIPSDLYQDGTLPTVTDEVSCRMVEPHRQRSAYMGKTNGTVGVHAPSLRALPQFDVPDSAGQGDFQSRPKLLAVNFPRDPAQVFVNTTLYSSKPNLGTQLDLQPSVATRYSLTLPYNEPRSYPATNEQTLVYEGAITGILPNGFLETRGLLSQDVTLEPGVIRLRDPAVRFCDAGVSDPEVTRELLSRAYGVPAERLAEFSERYADYIVLTSDFPASEDPYWTGVAGQCSRASCDATFGRFDAKERLPSRDFQITSARQSKLWVRPRAGAQEGKPISADDEALVEQARCCFPSGSGYEVRASNQWVLRGNGGAFRHQLSASVWDPATADFKCERDCNPRKRFWESRVFEIAAPGNDYFCGARNPGEGVQLDEPAARCIHSTASERFAVYRGSEPSLRDMRFTWQVVGGFSVQRIDLTALSVSTSPQTLFGLPQFSWLTVVDGASLGLTQLSLDSLGILTPPLN